MRILICDDEKDITDMLERYFVKKGYEVLTANNGEAAIKKAEKNPDIMPDIDGLNVCRKIRDFVSCPILFLTARIEESDKLQGFASGGDDYVVKPFSLGELGARVDAHLRREQRKTQKAEVRFDDDLVINYTEHTVCCRGQEISFVKKEFAIIEFLSQHPGQIFDREQIYEKVWSLDGEGDNTVVTEHIRRIRAKFAAIGAKAYIGTVWGCGYKWER